MIAETLHIDRKSLNAFCRRNGIKTLQVFGSAISDGFDAESDVDVLIQYRPGQVPSFFDLIDAETELSELFGGRRIDLVTPNSLHPRIRERALASAETLYAEA